MKKYLLPPTGDFYKTNLHCHTTFSDGKTTPEQVKDYYKKHGYNAIAFTDHDILIAHDELNDDEFIALHGFEVEINESAPTGTPFKFIKTCHICFVALEPDNMVQPLWHRSKYLFGHAPEHRNEVIFDENEPDFEREYTGERISEMMRIGREKGFFVTYNHPTWSMESYPEYTGYNGMYAMEIINHECCTAGYDDHNERVYDDMLRAGKRIYCIAADDNHNYDSMCGGFTMIKADKLEYKALTDALVKGNFYCSEGPEIKELWIEDGKVHIETSEAAEIRINYGYRRAARVIEKDGIAVTDATFPFDTDDIYFRITVKDKSGKFAYTNAYFIDELTL